MKLDAHVELLGGGQEEMKVSRGEDSFSSFSFRPTYLIDNQDKRSILFPAACLGGFCRSITLWA